MLKIEGCTKSRRRTVRVQKKHANGKSSESNPNSELTGVVMHCNWVLG